MTSLPPSKSLVSLIEFHAEELTNQWLDLVQKDPRTATYHTYDRDELYGYAFDVYSHLSKWLSYETTKEDIARIYTALGKRRRIQGFKLSEVIHALILTRRVLWFKILSEGLLDTALDLNRAMDLNNHTVVFFDRATYYIAHGFESQVDVAVHESSGRLSTLDKIMRKTDLHWRL
jgi:hypothetical protein